MVWSTLGPMATHRHGLGVAVLEGPLYAVGGHDGWSYLNTVERFVQFPLGICMSNIMFLNLQLGSDCSNVELRSFHVIDAIDGWRSSDVWSFVCGRWS